MTEKINLLLVEDNPGDAELVEESLQTAQTSCALYHVADGAEAMAYLRREGKYQNATQPDLILMDLNMPQKGGREVLKEIKADSQLRKIPVIIMSTSQADRDVAELYNLQASAYVEKPMELERYNQIMQAIESFWFGVVRYPPKGEREGE